MIAFSYIRMRVVEELSMFFDGTLISIGTNRSSLGRVAGALIENKSKKEESDNKVHVT